MRSIPKLLLDFSSAFEMASNKASLSGPFGMEFHLRMEKDQHKIHYKGLFGHFNVRTIQRLFLQIKREDLIKCCKSGMMLWKKATLIGEPFNIKSDTRDIGYKKIWDEKIITVAYFLFSYRS